MLSAISLFSSSLASLASRCSHVSSRAFPRTPIPSRDEAERRGRARLHARANTRGNGVRKLNPSHVAPTASRYGDASGAWRSSCGGSNPGALEGRRISEPRGEAGRAPAARRECGLHQLPWLEADAKGWWDREHGRGALVAGRIRLCHVSARPERERVLERIDGFAHVVLVELDDHRLVALSGERGALDAPRHLLDARLEVARRQLDLADRLGAAQLEHLG